MSPEWTVRNFLARVDFRVTVVSLTSFVQMGEQSAVQVRVSCAMRASIKTPRAHTRVRLALRAHTPKPLALAFVSLVRQGSPQCLLQPASKVAIAHQDRRARRKVCDIQFAIIHLLLMSALHLPCWSRLSSNF